MNTVLLTGNSFSKVRAGVEQFSESLKKMFPGLRVISFEDTGQSEWPILKEPSKAKAIGEYLNENLNRFNPDIVFFNGLYGWALPKKTPYLKIGICHGTYRSFAQNAMPLGLDRLRTQLAYAWFEKKSFQNADQIISNSAFTQKTLWKDYGLNSVIVPFGIDFSVFTPMPKENARRQTELPLEKKIVLFVGRPDYSKGFDLAEKLAQQNPNWYFVSVTFPKANSKLIDSRGPFDSKELARYYAACDAVLFPSRFESFGFVTLEALACQRPIVVSDFGVARQINHPACLRVAAVSVSAFQNALFTALSREFEFKSPLEKEFGLSAFTNRFTRAVETTVSPKKERKS